MIDLTKVQAHKANKAAQPDTMPSAPQPQKPAAPVTQTTLTEKPSFVGVAKDNGISVDANPMAGAEKVETPLERLNEQDFYQRQQNGEFNKTSEAEYWKAQAEKNPDGIYEAVRSMLASTETPEEKRKRERREALGETFRGLGNLIGNVANLYYTHRGGQYIDLNSIQEKHRDRLQKLKDKQDALKEKQNDMLLQLKIGDLKNKRAERVAEREAERKAKADEAGRTWKMKYDAYMKELDNAYKMGQIDAQTKARLAEQAAKAKSDKELESFKQSNRMALKTTPSYGQDKAVTSARGSEGDILTRNSGLTKEEAMQIVMSRPDVMSITNSHKDEDGNIDWYAAAADVLSNGNFSSEELEKMGYKKGKTTSKSKSLPGVRTSNKKGKRLNL